MEPNALTNLENYGPYGELTKPNGKVVIKTKDINKSNLDVHFESILNIFKDGIETDIIKNAVVTVDFGRGRTCELTIHDYFFNLIMWNLIVETDHTIEPKHLFFEDTITQDVIKKYIDKFFIDENRKNFDNRTLNNIIDATLSRFALLDQFAFFFANTINLEDNIELMKKSKTFYDALHCDMSGIPIEDVKSEGMKVVNTTIEEMKNARQHLGFDHCLADSLRSKEGTNIKQFKEFAVNIGPKPDGQGGIFPAIINSSFINGGLKTTQDQYIESHTGRVAQVLAKMNVGTSGHFARLLGNNNMDTVMHPDPHYVCDSCAFEEVEVTSPRMLNMIVNRYYRTHPMGEEKLLTKDDTHLIGTKVYLRSPMTCNSYSRGDGICYRCYGDLAYTNSDINIGKIAAELLSSILTQMLLSAKHLLESNIQKLQWCDEFFNFFEVEGNTIKVDPNVTLNKKWHLIIDPNEIELENEEFEYGGDDDEDQGLNGLYNEHISEFIIETDKGERFTISTENKDKLYISNELNLLIRNKGVPVDDMIQVNLQDIAEESLFYIKLHNNELSKTLERVKDILNKNAITKSMDRHQILQAILETFIEGGINVTAVHAEVLLANQIRDPERPLFRPTFDGPNDPYELITLNQALTNNPSINISISYQKLARALYNPLTYKKRSPSFMDFFFMEKPQEYLNAKEIIPEVKEREDGPQQMIKVVGSVE